MRKLRLFALLLLVAAMLVACGGEPDVTEPPTQEVTEAPTDPPTDPPTEPPTEAPTEPLETVVGYHFTEPDGFTALSSNETLTILGGPDGDGTTITVLKLDIVEDFSEITEENFGSILGVLGDDQQPPELHALAQSELDGYPALELDYTMTTSEITARYRAWYVSTGDGTYAFIFADATADGAWADEFEASMATINLLNEGEVVTTDTTGLELYDLGCGLSMYAAPGMELMEQEGFAAFLADDNRAVMVIEDNKAEYGLYGLSLEDYASLYVDGETITGFEQDLFGNLATTFVSELEDGSVFVYYVVVKNTPDSFWLVQCACTYETTALYLEDYAQWCATIAETK